MTDTMQEAESATGLTALIATIGERDPDGRPRRAELGEPPALAPDDPIPQPTGPLLAARLRRPGAVYLLATRGVQRPAELTRDRIAAELGVRPVITWLEGDHASFDAMQRAVENALRAIRTELPEGADVIVCPSSGTPQMGQALTLVAMFLFPGARFVQALDPRYVTGMEERLRPFDPRATRVRFDLERAVKALRAGHWAVAADILTTVGACESRVVDDARPTIAAALRLALGMRYAEELEYDSAARALEPGRRTGFRAELEALKQWYAGLDRGGMRYTGRPRELAAITAWQCRHGALSRATVTAAMAWETAVTVALRSCCKLNPDKLSRTDLGRLPAEVRGQAREVGGRYRLEGQRLRRQTLEALNPTARQALAGCGAALEQLSEMRNQLVHQGSLDGYAPEEVITVALAALDTLFEALAWGSWRAAPSAPDRLDVLIERLADGLLPGRGG